MAYSVREGRRTWRCSAISGMANIKQQQYDAVQRTFFPTPTTENVEA